MDVFENTESVNKLSNFWEAARIEINHIKTDQMTFKSQELPLARIKKIMKLDEDVKSMMISAEAPILFAKAAELFIREITLRAWIHTERNKRRTLQRSDITLAVGDGDTDQFDFLIDIVPRDEINKSHTAGSGNNNNHSNVGNTGMLTHTTTGMSTKREETSSATSGVLFTTGNNNTATVAGTMQVQQQQQPTTATIIADPQQNHHQIIQTTQQTQNNTTTVSTVGGTQQQAQQQQVQYVLQLPVGATTTNALSGNQAIQIQMIPQQSILTTAGSQPITSIQSTDSNSPNTQATLLTTATNAPISTTTPNTTVIQLQQPQQQQQQTQIITQSAQHIVSSIGGAATGDNGTENNGDNSGNLVLTTDNLNGNNVDQMETIQLNVSNGITAVTPTLTDTSGQHIVTMDSTNTSASTDSMVTTVVVSTDPQNSTSDNQDNVIIKTEVPSPKVSVDTDQ